MVNMTNRQYQTAMAWLQEEWNKPSRSDHYLMRIAQYVLGNSKYKLDDFKVLFTFGRKKPAPTLSKEKQMEATKARWFSIVGYKGDKQ